MNTVIHYAGVVEKLWSCENGGIICPAEFDPNKKRTVFIVYRYDKETKQYNHYDSGKQIVVSSKNLRPFLLYQIKRTLGQT